MKQLYKRQMPLIISLIVLLVSVIIPVWRVVAANNGHFGYALDDPYIHMSVARNLVEHGVWGITRFEFSSVTSSLSFPLMLALGFKLMGIQTLLPLFINIAAAAGILIVSNWVLQDYRVSNKFLLATLIILLFSTPLPLNIFIGMEHLLHAFLSIPFFYFAAEILTDKTVSPQKIILFFTITFLLSATRYEGLFAIAIVCALLFLRGRFLLAIGTAFWGALSISIYGLYSISQGSLFLPNSVYIKGEVNNSGGIWGQIERLFPQTILLNLYETSMLWPILLVLIFAFAIFLIKKDNGAALWWTKINILGLILIGSIVLHVQFSTFLYTRYEAYLVTLIILVLAIQISQILQDLNLLKALVSRTLAEKKRLIPYLLIALVLISMPFISMPLYLFARAVSVGNIPDLTDDIYRQQYQMGLFIQRYYPTTPFAINDIGAISFLNDTPLLDLWGLGTIEIARVGGVERVSVETVQELLEENNVHHAIVYDEWVEQFIPATWIEVGTWQVEFASAVAHDTVHFYAATELEARELLDNLKEYEAVLPSGILIDYSYP